MCVPLFSFVPAGVTSPIKTGAYGHAGADNLGTINSTRRNGVPGGLDSPVNLATLGQMIYTVNLASVDPATGKISADTMTLRRKDGITDPPAAVRAAPPVDQSQVGDFAAVAAKAFV